MARITVEIDDAKAALLQERAKQYGLEPSQLVTASIEDLLSYPDVEFDQVATRVIDKNQELYKRLS